MKIKNIRSLTIAAAVLISASGCNKEKLLNPVPDTAVAYEAAFDYPYRIANQVLGLYGDLKGGGLYGGRVVVYGDIRGEDFSLEDPNLVTNADVWNYNPSNTANAVIGLWAASYKTINDCNLFIDGMAAKGTKVVGDALSNNYLGEARLIRALCYYNLLQYYAQPYAVDNGGRLGLPLRLTGIKGPGMSDMVRSKVADVYTQVLSDLDFAETNLPDKYSNAYTNTTRAHKNTAIALKTKVYLSTMNYAKVITEANKLVPATAPYTAKSGFPNTLNADIRNVFKTPYTTAESILSMPFTSTAGDIPGTQNGLQGYYFAASDGKGSVFSLSGAGIVADAGWKAGDLRRAFVYTAASGKKYLQKYPTASPADYTPVIRWAEVLLNLAEAKVRSTNTVDQQAVDILNAIRQRSDPSTVFAATDFADANALIAAILKERRIEFLGEGLRNNDQMRLLQSLPGRNGGPAVQPADQNYIWPASGDEKSLNKLWVD